MGDKEGDFCGYNTVSGAFHKLGCAGECGMMNPGELIERRRTERRKAEAEARIAALEAQLADMTLSNSYHAEDATKLRAQLADADNLNKSLGTQLQERESRWQARAEQAEKERDEAIARAEGAESELVSARLAMEQYLRQRDEWMLRCDKAEARAADLARLCQNLVNAVARTRKADDAVRRNSGLTADWDEHEDAHASLIIFENAAQAALNPDAREGGESE